MEIKLFNTDKLVYAEAENGLVINELQDAIDLMAEANHAGAEKILIREDQVNKDFFRLETGFAGEILQKFSNYRMNLAIIGDFSKYQGKSLRDFIRESNRGRRIVFVSTKDEALRLLSK